MAKFLFGFKGIWVLPFAGVAFVFSLLLLFAGTLTSAIQNHLIPALAVYLIGEINIVFWKDLIHIRFNKRRNDANKPPDNLPTRSIVFFLTIHFAWLVALIIYLFWQRVLYF
ncbi:MAG: hypothetical protein P8Z76_11705 [Alphaproteobacteria bacterium]